MMWATVKTILASWNYNQILSTPVCRGLFCVRPSPFDVILPIDFNKFADLIRPICLPSFEVNRVRTLANDEVIASGWGESKIGLWHNYALKSAYNWWQVLVSNRKMLAHKEEGQTVYDAIGEMCGNIWKCTPNRRRQLLCWGSSAVWYMCRYEQHRVAKPLPFYLIVNWFLITTGNIGSPLMVVDFKGRWIQIGSLIRRESCERTGIPGVYTNVESYVNWILENMEGRNILLIAVSSNAGYNTSTFAV